LPLPGAAVFLEGTQTSTQTDINGNYRLTGVGYGNVSVTVKFIGYDNFTKTVKLSTDQSTLDFKLLPSSKSLNEVVVIGYGSVKKSDLTGAVTNVTSKDFQQGQITTPEQLITGKVAGVRITSNSGAPGSGSTIRIRGGSSLNASNDPLIVIDGIPVDGGGIAGSANALALINPNDIESFSVLKDASATAIYGSRGANGVIIITTKKGQTGKPQIVFGTQYSFGSIAKKADNFSAQDFKDFVKNNTSIYATPALKAKIGAASTDWQNEIFQNASTNDNNLSVSGSLKNLPYRLSLGYLNQDGILKTDKLSRTSLSLNLSPKFFDNSLKVTLSTQGSMTNSNFADQGAIGTAVRFDPTQTILSGNSNYGGYFLFLSGSPLNATTGVTGLNSLAPRNPVALLDQRTNNGKSLRSLGSLQLDYTLPFLKDLRANLNLGYDIAKGTGTNVTSPDAATAFLRFPDAAGVYRSGVNNQYEQHKTNTVFDFYLNYVKDLKSIKSNLNVTAGTSYLSYETKNTNFADYSFSGVKNPTSTPNFPFDLQQNRLSSYYGRAIFTVNDKYIFTGTIRADASSRFAPQNRWGYFPSGAFAWRISNESFMKNVKAISDLKIRLGYGVTGQQDGIGNYTYYNGYSLGNQTAQYEVGGQYYQVYRPNAYNPNLKWEQTATSNVGLDFGIINNRITGSVDLYIKKTTDLINEITQSAGTNFTNRFIANVGSMENRGVEFSVNALAVDKKDFKLNLAFNTTFNKNEITKLTNVQDPNYIGVQIGGISGGTGNTIQIHSTGYPRASYYVYQQVYDANGKPVQDVYVDRNGDNKITNADLYRYKNPDAKVLLGFSSNFNYKKVFGGFVLRGSIGNYIYNNVASSTGTQTAIFNSTTGILNNGSRDLLNTNFEGTGTTFYLSDYYVQNASFLRMDNLNAGYNFGRVIKGKANLSLNASVQNVFVVTKYKGIDPEIEGGIDNNFYPRPRTFSLGLNLNF
ncbi:MAG: SusC/RagA family TonB-linked outer membrane protein, partial [Bacteroidetes bacterium]|nr:SusC/RagA family TonB-linked outer membrane protein [Bacteroidota bacterium]